MGMNYHLYPCQKTDTRYYGDILLEVDKWVDSSLGIIISNNHHSINLPVEVPWVNKRELRRVDEIDMDCTWLVDAKILKDFKFYEDNWHLTRVVQGKIITACLSALPDNWPIIIYYV